MNRMSGIIGGLVFCLLPGQLDADSLVVDLGEVYELWGYHSYDSVTIRDGGTLRVPGREFDGGLFGSGEWEGGWLNLHTTGDFIVEDGGWLNANYSGYSHWDNSLLQDSWGPGAGQNQATLPPGGGGYGGEGGHIVWAGSAGQPYGSASSVDYGANNSIQMGSAGGSVGFTIQDGMLAVHAAGGAGGGGVLVSANSSAIINGTISTNGQGGAFDASLESAGGSGGQIVIDSPYVRIGANGSLQATGGNTQNSGAGGGGRIKMGPTSTLVMDQSAATAFDVSGGTASQSDGCGDDGSIFIPQSSELALDDGFESGSIIDEGWPTTTGRWSGDTAAIVSSTGPISPYHGSSMLQFIYAGWNGPGGAHACDLMQIVDLSGHVATIASGGAKVTLSAFFNRIQENAETDTKFSVFMGAYEALPGEDWSQWYSEARLAGIVEEMLADGDVASWEAIRAELVLPENATKLLVLVRAYENIHNDYSGTEFDGHFADCIVVSVTPESATPGDTNGDGVVSDQDYDVFVSEFGATGDLASDFNGDGKVDLEDFVILRGNFGYGVESAPAAAPGAITPEPATMMLLIMGGFALIRRRR